ncbi:hypothetical protein [Streptomyces kanasensis]|uniref:hypothetical protein n=1 Tax=Streptomyces kanasensis TaxID=936756 RepID=UPI00380A08B0
MVHPGLAASVVPEVWTAVREPDLETFRALTALADGAGAIRAQVVAWDLLIGSGRSRSPAGSVSTRW